MTAAPPYDVLAATGDAPWESRLVADLGRRSDVTIVRRCVDLADLLASAATVAAHAALIGPDVHRLDRDALGRLAEHGVAAFGMCADGDQRGRARLEALGLLVVPASSPPADVVAAVAAAVDRADELRRSSRHGRSGHNDANGNGVVGVGGALRAEDQRDLDGSSTEDGFGGAGDGDARRPGCLVAVWGPTGAPGRTTVAVNLAAEAARLGVSTLLADADTYGASIGQHLGLLDEAPGLAAAVRRAGGAALSGDDLARHARQLNERWRVLTGIARPDRWPELRPAALGAVWTAARELAELTVVDTGFALERDEELSFDVVAPRRNAATLETLEAADVVVVVGAPDPIGLQRLVRGLDELAAAVPGVSTVVVINRMRRGLRTTRREVGALLHRYAGVDETTVIPDGRDVVDAALLAGQPLVVVAPRTPVRVAVRELAARVVRTWVHERQGAARE